MTIDREELSEIKKRNEYTFRFKQNLTEAEADRATLLAALEAAEAREARLREALADCASDLESEINADFPVDVRAQYPVMQDKYEREMTTVHEARAALAETAP